MKCKKFTLWLLIPALCLGLFGCTKRMEPPVQTLSPDPELTPVPTPSSEPVMEPEPTPEPVPTPSPAPDYPAEKADVKVVKDGVDYRRTVEDGVWETCVNVAAGEALTIESPDGKAFSQVYIVWSHRPSAYTVRYPDGSEESRDGVLLHETLHLSRPTGQIELVAETDTILPAEISVYTDGYLPQSVQDWQLMADGEADICLFPAHADDEYVFFGGILPYYAGELGLKVQVCWMVCHDREYYRNHELLNALWKSGCVYYPQIHYEADDYQCWIMETAVAHWGFDFFEAYQVEMIRKYRPYVVVGHDEKGEYGHGAHILSSATLEKAAVDAAEPDRFPASAQQYGVWDVPKTYIHVYGENYTVLDDSIPLEKFGGRTALEVALDCYQEHVSQAMRREYTVYTEGDRFDARLFGLQRSTVGEDEARNDLLEHIDLRAEKPKLIAPKLPEQEPYPLPEGAIAISDAEGLRSMARDPEGSYALAADVDMAGEPWTPFSFRGSLDGCGHTIYNLTLSDFGSETFTSVDGNLKEYDTLGCGLFSLTEGANISHLRLLNVRGQLESDKNCFAAAFAGGCFDTVFTDCACSGELTLITDSTMVGIGGMAGFGISEFHDCRTDMTLVHLDRNHASRAEQFTGGILACGHGPITGCSVTIRGYTSCNGYVHDGGLVGMHYEYDLVYGGRVVEYNRDNRVDGFIRFYEHNPDRRAYCEAFIGENLLATANISGNNSHSFERQEVFTYDRELLPHDCDGSFTARVLEPTARTHGYTLYVCDSCGYEYTDRYTLPTD